MLEKLKKQIESLKRIFEEKVNNCKIEHQGDFAIRTYKDDLDSILGQIKNFEELHAEAESIVKPLKIDEVSAAFIANLRVTSWENLGEMYGGHKLGKIYSYILSVLNEKIEESTAATIKIEAPLYEQYSTVESRKETSEDFLNDEKECMYCKEAGIKNKNVFVEVSDPELGVGWICKECFLEADKEQKEELARLDLKVSKLEKVLEDIKRSLVVKTPPLPIRPLNKFLINKMRMLKAKIEKGLEDEY